MSIVNKMYLKNAQGEDVFYDIGAEASNVSYTDDGTSSNVQTKLGAVDEALDTHLGKDVYSQAGAHNIRYQNNSLDVYKGEAIGWDPISTGGGSAEVIDVTGVRCVSNVAGNSVSLTWVDPEDSKWLSTKIVRQTNRPPQSANDGTSIGEFTTKNAHVALADAIVNSGLTTNTLYYYGFFFTITGGTGYITGSSIGITPVATPTPGDMLKSTYDPDDDGVIATAQGGTGNKFGYIRTGRLSGSVVGSRATIEGLENVASGLCAHAEGGSTYVSGDQAHAEGEATTALGKGGHSEGGSTTAAGNYNHAEGYQTYAKGDCSHAEGYKTTAGINNITAYTHAEGNSTCATASQAHTEGFGTTADGNSSHAEGTRTYASGDNSHAEGDNTIAIGLDSHAEGSGTSAHNYAHAEGSATLAYGNNSHAEGSNTTAYSNSSHAEGNSTIATGPYSHAEGSNSTAEERSGHAEGENTKAGKIGSHAEGLYSCSYRDAAHAEGWYSTAYGLESHAEGGYTYASGDNSHASGQYTTASNYGSNSTGKFNAAMTTGGTASNTTGTAFVIGNGTSASTLSNAFSVQYNGTVKAKSTITASTTADYAEYFEQMDENPNVEDRVGHFVTFEDGNKIRIATSNDDYILGVVSGEPFVLGNGDCDVWNGMVVRDAFRRVIYEPAQLYELNPETGEMEPVVDEEGNPVYEGTKPVYNPDYDPTLPYISRADRPEQAAIGMLGVLSVIDDGTCEINGYCTISENGTATKAENDSNIKYRVIKRNAENVVEIVFR